MDISITLKRFESFHVACNNNAFCTFAFYLRHAEHFCYLNSVVVSKPLPLYSSSFYNQFMSLPNTVSMKHSLPPTQSFVGNIERALT